MIKYQIDNVILEADSGHRMHFACTPAELETIKNCIRQAIEQPIELNKTPTLHRCKVALQDHLEQEYQEVDHFDNITLFLRMSHNQIRREIPSAVILCTRLLNKRQR